MRITHSDCDTSMMFHGQQSVRNMVKNHISGRDGIDHIRHAYDHAVFAPFAWPGGYTIIFSTADDCDTLCADCAKKVFILENKDVNCDIYYEGPTMHCDECNCEIESAYGDPDEPEKE